MSSYQPDSTELLTGGDWKPSEELVEVTRDEVRLSRGFLRIELKRWFESLESFWIPLIYTIGTDFRFLSSGAYLNCEEEVDKRWEISIGGDQATICLSNQTFRLLAETITQRSDGSACNAAVEYLIRRFVATLNRSWSGPSGFVFNFVGETGETEETYAGYIKIAFEISGTPATIWISLTQPIVERLDIIWRKYLVDQVRDQDNESSENEERIEVEIAELSVQPSVLIDYLRAGAVIKTERAVSAEVILRKAGHSWLMGELCRSGERLAIRVLDADILEREPRVDLTQLQVTLGHFLLSREDIIEFQQLGAIIETPIPVENQVALIIDNERVSRGVLGKMDGKFVVNVATTK